MRLRSLVVVALWATAAPLAGAQDLSNLREAFGLSDLDGRLAAIAPDYQVVFGPDGIELTPALGDAVARDMPLEFALTGIFRESRRGSADAPAVRDRRREGNTVHYDRSFVSESYEVRRDGVEQFFTFESLPEGDGDLVVRGRVTTSLPHVGPVESREGLRFEIEGVGGITIGAVTGIDADGMKTTGSLRLHEGHLELVLPERFVDAAALPLVLDPLFGTATPLSSGFDDMRPDVAWSETANRFCVVYERKLSASSVLILGLWVDTAGNPIGNPFFVEGSSGVHTDPGVAYVRGTDTLVFTWRTGNVLEARGMIAGTTLTAAIPVGVSVSADQYDIGGDGSSNGSAALCVARPIFTNNVEAIRIDTTGGVLAAGAPTRLYTGTVTRGGQRPRIAKSGGREQRFLAVWLEAVFATPSEIRGAVIDQDLTVRQTNIPIASSTTLDSKAPEVDGDGLAWVVAYERREGAGINSWDIYARPVRWNEVVFATTVLGSETPIETGSNDDEIEPSVCWLGGSALVAWADESPNGYDAFITSIDPFTCAPCEGRDTLETQADSTADLVMAASANANYSGSITALVVWDSLDAVFSLHDIVAHVYSAADGFVSDRRSLCDADARAYATCARVGNAGFTHRLLTRLSSPSPAFLVLSPRDSILSCGSCVLYADPFAGYVFPATMTLGEATVAMPIPMDPNVRGARFIEQWIVLTPPAGGCSVLQAQFSNALSVTIQ